MRVEVRPYRRPFRQPLQTAHGLWPARSGFLLRFTDDQGHIAFGEIAPLPWFGTETLEQARQFCDRWPRRFAPEQIAEIPDTLPACQFGFSAAPCLQARLTAAGGCSPSSQRWEDSGGASISPPPNLAPAEICALLPAGSAALEHWPTLWQKGQRTFKWKIGVTAIEHELAIFQQLVAALPDEANLRLDANGGLTAESGEFWLSACDRAPIAIEFLEQPLSPHDLLDWLPQVRGKFDTAIALDESVATLQQLQQVHQRVGNQVVYVVKPAIAGFTQPLLDFCRHQQVDLVLSSALETTVGRNRVFQLARSLWASGVPKRALGFGVGHWFAHDWENLSEEELWKQL